MKHDCLNCRQYKKLTCFIIPRDHCQYKDKPCEMVKENECQLGAKK
jgi:hypothetical protein